MYVHRVNFIVYISVYDAFVHVSTIMTTLYYMYTLVIYMLMVVMHKTNSHPRLSSSPQVRKSMLIRTKLIKVQSTRECELFYKSNVVLILCTYLASSVYNHDVHD